MFSSTSRYVNLEIAKWSAADGRVIAYVRRRFLPPLTEEPFIEYEVAEGDHLDNLTARYLGDPEQFWRVCDVNSDMRPDQLTATIGRRVRILPASGG